LKAKIGNIVSLKKVFITGFSGSGKSTVAKYLDYHSNINTIHSHEKVSSAFYGIKKIKKSIIDKKMKWIEGYTEKSKNNFPIIQSNSDMKNIKLSPEILRLLLAKFSHYEILEMHSFLGSLFDNTSTNSFERENFDFDFFKFDKIWFEKIFAKTTLTFEDFLDYYLESYFSSWNNHKKPDLKNDIFLYHEANLAFDMIDYYFKENVNFKCIFVYRDLPSLIYSKFKRTEYFSGYGNCERSCISALFKSNFRKTYYHNLDKINFLQNKYPKQFLIVDLNEFLTNTKKSQNDICEFLSIEFEDNILHPSVGGYPVNEKYSAIGDKFEKKNCFESFLIEVCKKNNLNKILKYKYIKYLLYILYYKLF